MRTPSTLSHIKGYRYPREVVTYAVWVYCSRCQRLVLADHGTEKNISTTSLNSPLGDCCAFICRSRDHRFIKKITRPMQTFKSFNSAAAMLAGIEVVHMIRKGQFDQSRQSGVAQFAAFAE